MIGEGRWVVFAALVPMMGRLVACKTLFSRILGAERIIALLAFQFEVEVLALAGAAACGSIYVSVEIIRAAQREACWHRLFAAVFLSLMLLSSPLGLDIARARRPAGGAQTGHSRRLSLQIAGSSCPLTADLL